MATPYREVTFLFTDIEGSTRLWEEDPEAMSAALRRHDEILRSAIRDHGGAVFKTVGDAFRASFEVPAAALGCAADVQRALRAEPWPGSASLRVRMAVHTGLCEERDGDFFGPALNRVARLESAAHGGQVVVSQATFSQVGAAAPVGASLHDLGEHVLKDLTRPEAIYQLDVPGLGDVFPPLRTLSSALAHHNLPLQLTSFIGRDAEIAALAGLVGSQRLVSVVGAGGTGKTRLSLQLAADYVGRYAGGVWFVELGSLREADHVAASLASLINTAAAGSSLDAIAATLGDSEAVVILDNCEHLLDAAAALAIDLLKRCPGVRVLATSREPLSVDGECVFRLPSMAVLDEGRIDAAAARSCDAVRLFEDRARLQSPGFEVDDDNAAIVASLCRQLDGVALSIELAATKLRTMSLVDVEGRLGDHLRLLAGSSRSASPRQRSLRAMLDWSFELLDDVQREALGQLSVFAGDWGIASAEDVVVGADAVGVLEVVSQLVDKSLVQVRPTRDATRYFLLESVRQYGVAKLREDETLVEVQERHARHFQKFCAEASAHFHGHDQFVWLARAEVEWDNIVRAIEFLTERASTVPDALEAAVNLRTLFLDRFKTDEGATLVSRALAHVEGASASLLARAWEVAGRCYNQSRRIEASRDALERGLVLARDADDDVALGRLAQLGAYLDFNEGRWDEAVAGAREAVRFARAAGEGYRSDLVVALRIAGAFRSELGGAQVELARRESAEALALARELGDVRNEIRLLEDLGLMAIQAGDAAAAREDFERVVALAKSYSPGTGQRRRLANVSINLATVAIMDGDVDALAGRIADSLSYDRRWVELVPYQVLFGALCASLRGDLETAVVLHGASDALIEHYAMQREAVEAALRERDLEGLRGRVEPGRFDDLTARGRSLGQEESLALVDGLLARPHAGSEASGD